MGSSGVCIIPGLQEEEKAALHQRGPKVLGALQKLGIQAAKAPVVAVLGSGGGLRAHIACLGVLSEMKELGLLDAVMYLAGVSGSTWALSWFYANNGKMEGMEEELKHRYENCEWSLKESLEKTIQAARMENYSLTDFWAYLVVSRQIRELQDSHLSSIKKPVEEGTLPYPIFAAIDGDLQPAWRERKTQKSWFEFTPHHAGYPALGAYVPITEFGSRFEKGELVKSKPERDLTFLRGLWGSVLADFEEIKKFILAAYAGVLHKGPVGTAVDEALLDLVMAYIQDQDDSSIQEKFQALQQALDAERGESGELEHSWLVEMGKNWSKISPDEQKQFLEYLVHCFMRTRNKTKETAIYSSEETVEYSSVSWIRHKLWDIFTFLNKTGSCYWKWEWGTVHNFLYKHGNLADEAMQSREFLHLIDAGLAINTPYPLVLPPTRKVHLILSFDFSAGDPLETIRATGDYCRLHEIPFPQVEEKQLKEWAQAPASCYILEGETGPVVMHFTLFNKDNCYYDIETWRKKYDTMKLSDTYTPDLVMDLLRVSKENVRMNKDKILSEMQKVAREPPNFPVVNKEEHLEDIVKDVQCSRRVEINISNNTGLTFTGPLFYFQSGHAPECPPSMLHPESTVTCSFVKKSSSFESTVGLMVYQGPDFHLAFLFSAPFSYALHRVEFALAVLTGPVSKHLQSVFDNIIQGKESQELKVEKCVLQVPQGTLQLEHDSLIIRATIFNIHVAKMDVVVETKAS
ncbi:cytosolic phospholipase A2 gamma [Nannospalax galili]|uniref:cytosolic phospholipase A2 gamma n=1 Tax=Nannospalax galili TaxID=1026970 RepID=UPI0004ED4A72|nr:cytosolic phospholipase A2 gamma [Nannospalax galili]